MSQVVNISGPIVSPASGGAPDSLVVLLHGYGSNGQDLLSLAPLWRSALPNTLFIAPNAPEACPGAPGGFQWWPLTDRSADERSAGVRKVAAALNSFLDEHLKRYGLTDDRMALVGFSQGTMLALHVGLRRAKRLAGIVGYSGMLVAPDSLREEIGAMPPILLVHGDADPTVPIEALHQAAMTIGGLGGEVATHVCRGLGHCVDGVGVELGGDFLVSVFSG